MAHDRPDVKQTVFERQETEADAQVSDSGHLLTTLLKAGENAVRPARRRMVRTRAVASLFPFRQPPLLLLAYPRSGSSWVGDILARSPDLSYLREPINEPLRRKVPDYYTLREPETSEQWPLYVATADRAFKGIPPGDAEGVEWHVGDFSLLRRGHRRLLIKEVNPVAIRFFQARYQPQILLLLRHPAAVALSFYELGWLASSDSQRDPGNGASDAWERFGFTYGAIMKDALAAAASDPQSIAITHESLALAPKAEYRRLFETCALALPRNFEAIIHEFCHTRPRAYVSWATRRTSATQVTKWKQRLSADRLKRLKNGYERAGLPLYASNSQWWGTPEQVTEEIRRSCAIHLEALSRN